MWKPEEGLLARLCDIGVNPATDSAGSLSRNSELVSPRRYLPDPAKGRMQVTSVKGHPLVYLVWEPTFH